MILSFMKGRLIKLKKKIMKKTKVLVPALGILCLSMAASVSSTFAWFAANQTVYAKNMQVKSSTPASLVIGEKFNQVGKAQEIVFSDPTTVKSLAPATHDSTYGTGLKVVTNGDLIDPETGLVKTEEVTDGEGNKSVQPVGTLTYANASADTNYVDYVCYIASAGDAIAATDAKKLSVTIQQTNSAANGETISACSVDFYVKTVTGGEGVTTNTDAPAASEFKGTLNVAGLDAVTNDGATQKTSVDLIPTTANMTIPTESGASAIKVLMRVYFDGALLKSAGQAYVYTNSIDVTTVKLNATFSITSAD